MRALAATWDEINANHFRGRLARPVMALHEGKGRLGFWDGHIRTVSLSRPLVLETPWSQVREVLKHEAAHQFVEEILGERGQSAHGPAFQRLCETMGIDAAATGLPAAPTEAGTSEDPVLRRIARLLALAESPNLHEAEAAMQQAGRLMLRHNIDATVARAKRGYGFRHVGQNKRRIEAARQVLASILSTHFFVDVIWIPSFDPHTGTEGRVLELCGTPANLEVAAWVYTFLTETSERLWQEHKRQSGVRGDRDRRRFKLGVMMGFEEKLQAGAKNNRQEGLIWRGDPELEAYLGRRYPRRTGGGRIGYHRDAAYEHGRQAGHGIVLHKTLHSHENRGRFLPPAR